MPSHDLCWLSAAELSRLYRRKKVSPVEVLDAILDRIGRVNPRVNAYVLVAAEQARKDAKAAEHAPSAGGGPPSAPCTGSRSP